MHRQKCTYTHNQGQNQTTQILGSFQAHALNLTSFYLITKWVSCKCGPKGGKNQTKPKQPHVCVWLFKLIPWLEHKEMSFAVTFSDISLIFVLIHVPYHPFQSLLSTLGPFSLPRQPWFFSLDTCLPLSFAVPCFRAPSLFASPSHTSTF